MSTEYDLRCVSRHFWVNFYLCIWCTHPNKPFMWFPPDFHLKFVIIFTNHHLYYCNYDLSSQSIRWKNWQSWLIPSWMLMRNPVYSTRFPQDGSGGLGDSKYLTRIMPYCDIHVSQWNGYPLVAGNWPANYNLA